MTDLEKATKEMEDARAKCNAMKLAAHEVAEAYGRAVEVYDLKLSALQALLAA